MNTNRNNSKTINAMAAIVNAAPQVVEIVPAARPSMMPVVMIVLAAIVGLGFVVASFVA